MNALSEKLSQNRNLMPFYLCKLEGQKLEIWLRNRVSRIWDAIFMLKVGFTPQFTRSLPFSKSCKSES